MRRSALGAAIGLVLLVVACDVPRDPEGTLDRVTGGVMRVGISENPPWTTVEDGRAGGVEASLVEDFARELGARIEWVPGTETGLLQALHRFELDIVIAGLTDDTAWVGMVGLSKPYVRTTSLIGVPTGVTLAGGRIEGREVAVSTGDPVAAQVRGKDFRPVPMPTPDLAAARLPVAAEDWQLAAWNFAPTSITFAGHGHVIAVPPGENGFLYRLERFLAPRSDGIRQMLIKEAGP